MLQVNNKTGLVENIRQYPSPFYNERPENMPIDMVVLHSISLPPGEFQGDAVHKLFLGQLDLNAHPYYQTITDFQVASHIFMRRDGELIQYVPFHKRAWHAGVSEFEGRQDCNDFSIGIELEGHNDIPYTEEQYGVLLGLLAALTGAYPHISQQRIVGHHTISPGRKTDPGASFDWARLEGV